MVDLPTCLPAQTIVIPREGVEIIMRAVAPAFARPLVIPREGVEISRYIANARLRLELAYVIPREGVEMYLGKVGPNLPNAFRDPVIPREGVERNALAANVCSEQNPA